MKNKTAQIWLPALAVFAVILIYFLKWRTATIYGDDLYDYKYYTGLHSLREKISVPTIGAKFRPVHGILIHLMISLFHKNLWGYYVFNVMIQSLATLVFARVIDLFLKNPLFSLSVSLIWGLSRYAFYTVTQVLNGCLEGTALLFFLVFLFYILKLCIESDLTLKQKNNSILLALLFANLAICTHERYIVVFPFVVSLVLFFPTIAQMSWRRRLSYIALSVGSILVNYAIKEFGYHFSFFVGTSFTEIKVSFSSAATFFKEALISLFMIDTGPEYLNGIKYADLPAINKLIVGVIAISLLSLVALYVIRGIRDAYIRCIAYAVDEKALKRQPDKSNYLLTFVFLLILLILLLVPAVLTIRLEQRWLQAPYCVLIVMILIGLKHQHFVSPKVTNALLLSLVACTIFTNVTYLNKGFHNTFMKAAEVYAYKFKRATESGVIHPSTSKIFIVDDSKNTNEQNALFWSIGGGSLFDFYQTKDKQIVFTDSVYKKTQANDTTLLHFNGMSDQMVYLKDTVTDITRDYLKDSLKNIKARL